MWRASFAWEERKRLERGCRLGAARSEGGRAGARREPEVADEGACQVTLVREPTVDGDLGQITGRVRRTSDAGVWGWPAIAAITAGSR